ncbi:hypothetical protein LIER_33991 [Lithospermum erythrorhizon]|uniref:Retroviral polymerase SH3-like domain-containing protein n=1 Tax=Lithospermum erythrorhizon TaxID=34254 RepID=A0AAV3RY77_LITER
MFQSSLPIQFWEDAILVATHIINRLSSSHLEWKSPYELLYNKPPDLETLRVFGCLCFFSNNSPHKANFDHRAFLDVFVRYPIGQKGCKVYDLSSKKIVVSRDAKFCESSFPFHSTFDKSHLIDIKDHVPHDESTCFPSMSPNHEPIISDIVQPFCDHVVYIEEPSVHPQDSSSDMNISLEMCYQIPVFTGDFYI